MKRRDFIRLAASTTLFTTSPFLRAAINTSSSDWRTYELAYEIDLSEHKGAGRLWLPLPQHAGNYQRVLSINWSAEANTVLHWDETYKSPILSVTWNDGDNNRHLKVTSQVATRDNQMASAALQLQNMNEATLYLQPTKNIPVDGIVKETSEKIVKGLQSPEAKAKAIYEWIVDNTFRDPKVEGCGFGDIKSMLETGNLSGKCADINSLFVGLARAEGIPAREFYGVRVDDSTQFKCLGKSGVVSRAQHCRAEFFTARHGWVPVDPADVRKVVLEENLLLNDKKVVELRNRLFGFWEMNWIGFNNARDFTLPGQTSAPLPYLMYPYAEFGKTRLNGRNPDDFKFQLRSQRIS